VITASQVKGQVRAALWLLCQFGGVGSKSRKGLGSLQLVHDSTLSLDGCKSIGKEFRDGCGVKSRLNERPETPALECMLDPVQVVTPWNDVWFALDQVGFSAQAYAKKFKHDRTKCALGLPRRIGAPVKGEFRSNLSRHTSPVHLHLARQEPSGQIVIRAVGFPAARLPDFATSRAFLDGYFRHLKDDLANRAKINAQPRDAPRAEPPKPKPHVEVKRGTEDWPKCHITWKPGSGELVVRSNTGKTTAISGEPAKTVLESLSQELRDRLKRNKELKGVDVHVSFEGSHYKLVRLG
jgi:CRISPR-associated protein Cmr6